MKPAAKVVENTLELQKDLNKLTVDKIADTAPKPVEVEEQKIDYKVIAKQEGIAYIEPKRKLPSIGNLPEKWKKMHTHDWEYVKGIFENQQSPGEAFTFTFSKWPGDPDCMWEVPSNKPVYVQRMIARHLSGEKDPHTGIQAMNYHTFSHIDRPTNEWAKDDFIHTFAPTGTHSRGRFRALGAF